LGGTTRVAVEFADDRGNGLHVFGILAFREVYASISNPCASAPSKKLRRHGDEVFLELERGNGNTSESCCSLPEYSRILWNLSKIPEWKTFRNVRHDSEYSKNFGMHCLTLA
jgi:hypothetical protein